MIIDTKPVRILYMEDDPGAARLFETTLAHHGYAVDIACDGDVGIWMYENGSYNVVAVDQNMPGREGLEVIRALAEHDNRPPMIMITAAGDERVAVQAMQLGAGDYVVKDLDGCYLELLPSVVERVLHKRRLEMEKERAEEALAASEARYRMLVENSPVGILSCDLEGNITELNPAASHILGSLNGGGERREMSLARPSLVRSGIAQAMRRCLDSGDDVTGEFPYEVGSSRGKIYVRLRVVGLCDAQGRRFGAQAVVEDVSEHRKAEGLRLHSERLKAMLKLAGRLTRNLGDSICVAEACGQMALNSLRSNKVSEIGPLLTRVTENNRLAMDVLQSVQHFAGTEHDPVGPECQTFDFSATIRKIIDHKESWGNLGREKMTGKISVNAALTEGCYVEGICGDLEQIAVNVLKNAVEALPSGGTITVKTGIEQDYVVLSIVDDGSGIAGENLYRVFEPFWTTKTAHAGMGLSIAMGIVRRHGGTILVTSRVLRGTTITVKIPYAKAPVTNTLSRVARSDDPHLRVLVVNPHRDFLIQAETELKTLGHTCVSASLGRAAIKAFEANEVDAVVCHSAMPDMSFWEISARIRSICERKGAMKPTFILAVDAESELTQDDLHGYADIDGLIKEPFTFAQLVETLGHESWAPEGDSDFSGRVRLDILDYLQVVLVTGQRVVLEIRSAREDVSGRLFIDRGAVRHAVCRGLEGEEAFHLCMSLKSGRFTSRPWREPERDTIKTNGEHLLMEAARRRDENRHLSDLTLKPDDDE